MCRQFALEHALRSACERLEGSLQEYEGVSLSVHSRSLKGVQLIAYLRFLHMGVWALDGDESFMQDEQAIADYIRLLHFTPEQLKYGSQWVMRVHQPPEEGVLLLQHAAALPFH